MTVYTRAGVSHLRRGKYVIVQTGEGEGCSIIIDANAKLRGIGMALRYLVSMHDGKAAHLDVDCDIQLFDGISSETMNQLIETSRDSFGKVDATQIKTVLEKFNSIS